MTNDNDHDIERLLGSTDLGQRSQIQQSLRKELLERMEHEPNKRSSWVLGAFGAGVMGLLLLIFMVLVLGNGGFTVAGSGGNQVEEEDPTESPTLPPSPTLVPTDGEDTPSQVDPSIGPLGDMTATPLPFDPNTMPTPTLVPFETTPTPTAHRGSRDEGFTNRLWVLVDLNGKTPIEGVEIIISFGEGIFSGTAGCNRYTGNYTTGVGSIQMTEITIHRTERDTCEDQAVLDQETEYLETLGGVAFYELTDGQLRISASGLPRWLVFEEKE